MFLEMFYMVSPLIINEVPHACSATYRPLWRSPIESGVVFPCSWVMMSAKILASLLRQATKSNMYLCRAEINEKVLKMGVLDQVLNASFEFYTMALNYYWLV